MNTEQRVSEKQTTARPFAHDLLTSDWITLFERCGEPAYRAQQAVRWIHQRHAGAYGIMSDLSEALRERLETEAPIHPIELASRQVDPSDGTIKALWKLHDGEAVETVKMIVPRKNQEGDEEKGATICLSTQVGCALACRFCATGRMGERRNLSAGEIVQQAYRLWEDDVPVKRLVYMGMGEPLRNYDNVMRSIELFRQEDGLNVSPRRITLSTVGLVPEIYRLARDLPGVRLAVSLHGTTDTKRRTLVPVARGYSIERIVDAARAYQEADGQRISFEYTLIPQENDSQRDAERLAELVEGMTAHINLIPYNPVPRIPFRAPLRDEVRRFLERVKQAGAEVSVRWSRGPKIDAACGQLRAQTAA